MANYTDLELYHALKLIQDVCKKQSQCCYCPLRQSETDFCTIQEISPDEYQLVRPDEYRPFR